MHLVRGSVFRVYRTKNAPHPSRNKCTNLNFSRSQIINLFGDTNTDIIFYIFSQILKNLISREMRGALLFCDGGSTIF
jgi:hypothetical protein